MRRVILVMKIPFASKLWNANAPAVTRIHNPQWLAQTMRWIHATSRKSKLWSL